MDEKTKTQTTELLEAVRKNAQMGTTTLEILAERLAANERAMAEVITKQLNEYRLIADAAGNNARELGVEPENDCALARTAASAMTSLQTLADKSPSHIAEMVIVGSTRGMISSLRALRTHPEADSDAIGLASRLLLAEANNIEELKRYL